MKKLSIALSTLFGLCFYGAGLLGLINRPEWSMCFLPATCFMIAALMFAGSS